jgi:hypothetical protein
MHSLKIKEDRECVNAISARILSFNIPNANSRKFKVPELHVSMERKNSEVSLGFSNIGLFPM